MSDSTPKTVAETADDVALDALFLASRISRLQKSADKAKLYRTQLAAVNRAQRLLRLEYKELKGKYDELQRNDEVDVDIQHTPQHLAGLLQSSFVWYNTPQGQAYWQTVRDNLRGLTV